MRSGPSALPLALGMRSYIHAISGELDAAESLLDEIRSAAEATGTSTQPYLALWISGLRGRKAETSDLPDGHRGGRRPRRRIHSIRRRTRFRVLYNGLEPYPGSCRRAPSASRGLLVSGRLPQAEWPNLFEAAVRSGDRRLAQLAHDRLVESTSASGTDWALGIEARSRALLSDDDTADTGYRESIERLSRTSIRLQLARTHLLYGEWLRRDAAAAKPGSSCAPPWTCSPLWASRASRSEPSAS